mgnify:CR=1 FL=1
MDDSLRTLVNETQIDNEEENYIIGFDLDDDMRQKYSLIGFFSCLIFMILFSLF